MNPQDYPEIKALNLFIQTTSAKFHGNNTIPPTLDLVAGSLILSESAYPVFINDEYQDLELPDERIAIVLALREFEIIEESTDYLQWCKLQGITAHSEEIRSYYQETVNRIPELKKHFNSGELSSFITDLDFQLNAGAMQLLRRS
ncbi:hypothetical protein J1N09_06405 [Aureitalea sp. L0-47]|uniref:hypothetical protein n=1 Tax=Aureitalea sp. L0-47 TaxID=2816962 RepID=UPI002237D696|nr:hypothetical protein [Aureitalea sp. L0-47]MCW5519461.1 hypothetical protein [Aureitalea sp. L0-47]